MAAKKGHIVTEETRRKIGEANKIALLGHIPWNKGKPIGFIPKMAFKKGLIPWNKGKEFLAVKGDKNHNLAGDNPNYFTLHKRIRANRRLTGVCTKCKKICKTEWANISHKYIDIYDFFELCRSCHREYDKNYQGAKQKRFG